MRLISSLILLLFIHNLAKAQQADSLKNELFSIHAQTTVITQFKLPFSAKYTGQNSLLPGRENQTSVTSTLFAGARLWKNASMFINPEIAGGAGLSKTLGVAAAPNGETYRVGNPAPQITLARLFFRQLFLIDTVKEKQLSDFNQLAGNAPTHYISFTIGKISVADYFDDNKYSHDPRTQFMSWALMDCGAWDYPANTKGYSPGIVFEYVNRKHELRYGFSLMPNEANGNDMNFNFMQANSNTLEYTYKYNIRKKAGALRILTFYSTANMGSYKQSITLNPLAPSVIDTRQQGRNKYGFVLNAEQDFTDNWGCFLRAGWNDGNNETWAFTEIDNTVSAGISGNGKKWKRQNDNAGVAFVVSAISKPHRQYLADGGNGFMLGDGQLNYQPEQLAEFYYSAALVKQNIYISAAYQLLINPAYNKDRQGPVNIFSVRFHAEI
jgi:high affinity Mn2+ porin